VGNFTKLDALCLYIHFNKEEETDAPGIQEGVLYLISKETLLDEEGARRFDPPGLDVAVVGHEYDME